MGITGIIGPAIFTQTFAFFIGSQTPWHLPGAPFFLGTLLFILAAAIAGKVTRADR
jgi:DHA1 family tetracycline resistance protein-like MFS transporter